MTRIIATRVNDNVYTKVLKKCAESGCSTYDYLRILVITDTEKLEQNETNHKDVEIMRETAKRLQKFIDKYS